MHFQKVVDLDVVFQSVFASTEANRPMTLWWDGGIEAGPNLAEQGKGVSVYLPHLPVFA
jgi:hypothetical protein